jgi:outer membrane protein
METPGPMTATAVRKHSAVSRIRPRAAAACLGVAALAACAPGTPRIDGSPGAPHGPSSLWPVPQSARTPEPPATPPEVPQATAALSADSATTGAVRNLSMTDVVDLALRNNPATRESWANARATASVYGAARGQLYPTVDANVNLSRTGTSGGAAGGSSSGGTGGTGADSTGGGGSGGTGSGGGGGGSTTRTTLTPSATLSYLVFDLGGRSGSMEAARQRAIAADLAHNATVRDVVLQVESSLFSYLATRALRDAQQVAVTEAEADLAAAAERHRVGVASVEEELQTRTALSQARLQLHTLTADLFSARGSLAVAMGFAANAAFDVPAVAASDSVVGVAGTVDALIARAVGERPELAEARAEARALAAQVRVARAAGYPALVLRSTGSLVRPIQPSGPTTRSYSLVLGLQIPVFNGFARQYQVRAARDDYEAALARVTSVEQQVGLQVFTSYYALQAATERVRTAAALVADAQQSAAVAAGRYRSGVGTIVDVLLARSALITARAEAIQSRWEWRTALAQLGHDVGVLDLAGRPNVLLGTDQTGARP